MFSFLRRNKKNESNSEIETDENSQHLEENLPAQSSEENLEQISAEPSSPKEQSADQLTAEEATTGSEVESEATSLPSVEEQPAEENQQNAKVGFFTRLKNGLSKTRQSFTESLAGLVLGKKEIDDDLLDDLEMILLTADVGIDAT
ncbi:MAG: signal recognition particle receptor subunit alpha, partial [Thiomicrorhabdus sp.]|nr:signal recognition particle receptor subunit alpha [Thiomicrorhabdus sp.]